MDFCMILNQNHKTSNITTSTILEGQFCFTSPNICFFYHTQVKENQVEKCTIQCISDDKKMIEWLDEKE